MSPQLFSPAQLPRTIGHPFSMSIYQPKAAKIENAEPDSMTPGWVKVLLWLGKRWILLTLLSLTLLGLGLWKGEALYQEVKEWRVERLIAASKKAQQAGDDAAAVQSLRQAWALLPRHIPTMRAMAEYEAWKR